MADRSWTHITAGIPDGGIVNVVREDKERRGLLYAGTEQAVYASFDDGDHWQSLRLNMPATSIRDLVVKDDDLVVGTHGRSFWILDDVTPLRAISAADLTKQAFLFAPQQALRWRSNKNTDTPLPQEEPAGQNPPEGAILHYFLTGATRGPVVLEILDAGGSIVRRFASDEAPEPPCRAATFPTIGCARHNGFPQRPACIASSGTCAFPHRRCSSRAIRSRRSTATRPAIRAGPGRSPDTTACDSRPTVSPQPSRSSSRSIRASRLQPRACASSSSARWK